MNLFLVIGLFAITLNYVAGQNPLIDVSCQPGYKANTKAEERIARQIKKTCEFVKNDPSQCYLDCVIQVTALFDYGEELTLDLHTRFMEQFMPKENARALSVKVNDKCFAAYEKAMGEDRVRCRTNEDADWHAFFDCVQNVWKCKA